MNITPDAWSSDSEALRARAQQAEARIQAVRDVLDKAHDEFEQPDEADILRALDGDA